MKPKCKKYIVGLALGVAAMLTIPGQGLFGAEQAAVSSDPELERTRAAARASKALFAAMKKAGWYDVRLLGLTDVIGDQDDVPRDAFEQTAAKKLIAGDKWYEEVSEKDGKRYLRVATGIPVVSENCLMCHANFKGNKGNIGALSYTLPVIK